MEAVLDWVTFVLFFVGFPLVLFLIAHDKYRKYVKKEDPFAEVRERSALRQTERVERHYGNRH